MPSGNTRVDAFDVAIVALAASVALFAAIGESGFAAMAGLCAVGLAVTRSLTAPRDSLTVLAIGLVFLIWTIYLIPTEDQRTVSFIAHVGGGALAAFAIFDLLGAWAMEWARRAWITLAAVIGLALGWEVAERLVDSLFDTALDPNGADTLYDLVATNLGAIAGLLVASVV